MASLETYIVVEEMGVEDAVKKCVERHFLNSYGMADFLLNYSLHYHIKNVQFYFNDAYADIDGERGMTEQVYISIDLYDKNYLEDVKTFRACDALEMARFITGVREEAERRGLKLGAVNYTFLRSLF